jgi:hypothetical protein
VVARAAAPVVRVAEATCPAWSPGYRWPRRGPRRLRGRQIDLVDGGDITPASGELHTLTSLHSPKQQGDVALKAHVGSVCFNCFIGILQVFHMDVAKLDQDVAYVAMVVHVCCKHLFKTFHLFFRRMLLVGLSGCCICFIHMLQVFNLDIAYILDFLSVLRCFCKFSYACYICFICL